MKINKTGFASGNIYRKEKKKDSVKLKNQPLLYMQILNCALSDSMKEQRASIQFL